MSFPRYPKYKTTELEWLPAMPEHWEARRFQRCINIAEGQVDPEDPVFAIMPLIAPNHIEAGTGRLAELESASEQAAESGKYLCKAGDVVYTKIRPSLRKVCIAPVDCLCSADMYPLRAHSGLTNRYLYWLILSQAFSSFVVLESQRVAMPKINRESLNAISLPLPPVSDQTAIATFLGRETTQIDTLIVEQQRLIELLQEKRQAVISHAVTKGLNPDAPMKPSGVEWLGDVPAHWDVMSVRRCVVEHRQGYYSTDPYVQSGVKLLRITDLRAHGAVDFSECPLVEEGDHLEPFLLASSDFVFARTGGAGSFGMVESIPGRAAYASYLIRFRFGQRASPLFLRYFFLSSPFQDAVRQNIHGGVNQNVHAEDIKNQYLALPPLSEQQAIVEALNGSTAVLDDLSSQAQRAVALLQERRTALISAVVTGKIDVRQLVDAEAA